jgi:TolB-like protein
VIELTYFQPASKREAVANRLSLSFGAYRRHLTIARNRLARDGITETLTTDLSRISDLFGISRNTAGSYKGRSINTRQIRLELSVRYVLEGSVQSAGSRVRINAQLVDAESGAHLWAERFDKPYADLLDTQDEVATRLARTIHVELIAAESRRAGREHANRFDSLDHTLNGWPTWNQLLSLEGARKAPARRAQRQCAAGRRQCPYVGSQHVCVGRP